MALEGCGAAGTQRGARCACAGSPSRSTLWTTRSHREIGEHIAGASGRHTARIGEGL